MSVAVFKHLQLLEIWAAQSLNRRARTNCISTPLNKQICQKIQTTIMFPTFNRLTCIKSSRLSNLLTKKFLPSFQRVMDTCRRSVHILWASTGKILSVINFILQTKLFLVEKISRKPSESVFEDLDYVKTWM